MRLVDRDRELAELRRGIASGAGRRIIAVTGVPGIGKTALLRAITDELRQAEPPLEILRAGGAAVGGGIAYGALRQLFRAMAATVGHDQAPFDGPGALLHRLVSGEPIDADVSAVTYAVHWVVSSRARHGGLALVLDDIQWLDPISGEVLASVLALAGDDALVVIAGIRETEREARTPFVATVFELADVVVTPAPLGTAAIGELLGTGPALAARVRELTGGIPFYVTELGHTLAAGESEAPARAVESIAARLDRLGDPARSVARAVCVLGPDAYPAFVARLAGIEHEQLDRIARALAGEGVLAPRGADAALSSAHPLIDDAVLAGLGQVALGRLRDQAARLLHDAELPASRVAAQLLLTEPTGDAWRVGALRAAAAEAVSGGAELGAITLLERALLEAPAPHERAELTTLLGIALLRSGRGADAARAWERELPSIAEPMVRIRRLMDIGDARYSDGDYESAEAAYRSSLELLEGLGFEPDSAPVLEHAARFATARLTLSPLAEVIPPEVLRAVQRHPAASLGREERRFLAAAALSAHTREDWDADPDTLAMNALGGGAFAVDGFADDPTTYALSGALYLSGRFDESLELLDRAVDDARRRHRVTSEIPARSARGTTRILTGSLLMGLDDLEAAIGLGRLGTNPLLFQVSGFVHLIRYSGLVGDTDRAARLAAELAALELPDAHRAMQQLGIAEQALAAGDPEAAARAAARSRALDSEGVFAWTFSWRGVAAAAALALGDPHRAAELNTEERHLLVRRRIPLGAHLDSVLLTARLQTDPEAHETLADYLERLPEAHRWQRAVVEERLGELLLASDPDDAHEHLLFALAVALEQGMLPLERRVRQSLRRLGREPVPSSLVRRIGTLSPSELRVASRAAQGASNREIARELFVTLKTVEFHLGRTFRKLGISSRTELDAAFAEAGENSPTASA